MSKPDTHATEPAAENNASRQRWKDLGLDLGAVSLTGGRSNNEDNFGVFIPAQQKSLPQALSGVATAVGADYLSTKGILLVVADGMGGGMSGKTASTLAVGRLGEYYYEEARRPNVKSDLRDSVSAANDVVCTYAESLPQARGVTDRPGSTVVAVALYENIAYVANVGDSRAYLIRGNRIQQITQDHVPEPGSHLLTRSLGDDPHLDVDLFEESFQVGDTLLLCSDGLYDILSDQEINRIVGNSPAQRAAERLAQEANRVGIELYGSDSYDNITAVVARRPNGRRNWPVQSLILGALALLTLLVFIALGVFAARFLDPNQDTATPALAPSLTLQATDTPAYGIPTPAAPLDTLPPPMSATVLPPEGSIEAATRGATSTPNSTSTPKPTSTPTLIPTFTNTPTPTWTSIPTEPATAEPTAPIRATRAPKPRSTEPPTSEPPTDEPPTDEPPTDEPPTDEPSTDEPPTDEPQPTREPPPPESPGNP